MRCLRLLKVRTCSVPARCHSSSAALSFEEHREAFRHKSTWELVRALAVLKLCSVKPLVDNSLQLMRGLERLGGETCLRLLLKRTLYAQFVGGETPEELRACMRNVTDAGMRCMLAATMEEDIEETGCEAVYQENSRRILEAIDMSAGSCPSPMIQLKLSGLLPARLLMPIGDCYLAADCRQSVVEALSEGLVGKSVKMDPFEKALTKDDQEALSRSVGRLRDICLLAHQKDVRVLVDAEFTYFKEGLSALTLGAAAAFNSSIPVVWNTYQCYLKKAHSRVQFEMELLMERLGVCFGAKIVRGAYMLQERQRALRLGLPDPLCENYEATCKNYDRVLSFLLDHVGPRCQFIAATHNEHSIRLIVQRIESENLDRRFVSFGQLYGMCEQISKPLAEYEFAVYKSVPYGTLSEVLPYLARRAIENKSVLEGARKEHALLVRELKMRLRPFGPP